MRHCRGFRWRRRGLDRADGNVAVIGNQFYAGSAAADLAAHTLPFPGARNRQAQLGLDLPIPGSRLHLKANPRGHGQIDGPIPVVDRDFPERRHHPHRDVSIPILYPQIAGDPGAFNILGAGRDSGRTGGGV